MANSEGTAHDTDSDSGSSRWKNLIAAAALAVSTLSLLISLSGFMISLKASQEARKRGNIKLLNDFVADSAKQTSAQLCFAFGNSLSPREFETAFARERSPMKISSDQGKYAAQCLEREDHGEITNLSAKDLKEIRDTIIAKLNSYDTLLMNVNEGLADAAVICPSLKSSFNGDPKEFARRVWQSSPKPGMFHDFDTDLPNIAKELNGKPCT